MIKAILFDFNGVIIDDEPIHMKAYQEVFKKEDIDITEEGYYSCLGMNDSVFVKTICERAEKDISDEKLTELIDAKTDRWKELIDGNIPLFNGIQEFVRRMENVFALGLVSMARRTEIDHVLDKTGLRKSFLAIVSSEDVSTTKPDPQCYREGFRRIDLASTSRGKNPITRRQCVIIEDSPAGIVSGKGARLKTLGVTNTVDAKSLRDAGADAVTGNLADWSPDSFNRVFR